MINHPDPKVQALVQELTEQRNVALDTVAVLRVDLAEANAKLAESNEALKALSEEFEKLKHGQPAQN